LFSARKRELASDLSLQRWPKSVDMHHPLLDPPSSYLLKAPCSHRQISCRMVPLLCSSLNRQFAGIRLFYLGKEQILLRLFSRPLSRAFPFSSLATTIRAFPFSSLTTFPSASLSGSLNTLAPIRLTLVERGL